MSNKKMVPEIRFKGFNDEWTNYSIEELINENIIAPPKDGNHGNIHPKSTDYIEYGIPFIMANNVRNGEIDYLKCSHISKKQADSLQKGFAQEGDVLLTHKGTVGEVAIIHKNKFPYIMLTPQVTYYRILNNERLYNYFIASLFVSTIFQNILREASGGGTRAYIGITEQQQLELTIPQKEEQVKIGDYFKDIDSLINTHQQKYDKLVTLKKAMLEKMFPKEGEDVPEIRFDGFTENWRRKTLGDFGKVAMNKRIFKYQTNVNQGIPFYKIGTFGDKADSYISKELFNEYKNKYPYPQKGDILISASGSIGKTVVYTGEAEYFQDSNIVWLDHSNKIHNAFLECFYHIVKWDGLEGSTIKRLYNNNILKTKIMIPSLLEQTKIGNYFKKLDKLISLQGKQVDKLKKVKKSCLDKMFV